MTEQPSHLNITKSDGVYVVEFADKKILEELCITEIGEELADLVAAEPDIRLLLNFANVEYLSSAALGVLIQLNKQVAQVNGRLKLSDIKPQIFEVFKITRLDKLFEIHAKAQHALKSF